jgi:hypothetical protein
MEHSNKWCVNVSSLPSLVSDHFKHFSGTGAEFAKATSVCMGSDSFGAFPAHSWWACLLDLLEFVSLSCYSIAFIWNRTHLQLVFEHKDSQLDTFSKQACRGPCNHLMLQTNVLWLQGFLGTPPPNGVLPQSPLHTRGMPKKTWASRVGFCCAHIYIYIYAHIYISGCIYGPYMTVYLTISMLQICPHTAYLYVSGPPYM